MNNTNEENRIEGKLIQSLEVKELGELATEYAELGIDSILDDGVIKDIPILRTLVEIAKIGLNIRDRIYVKKIMNFLSKVGQTSREQREEFVKKYCEDKKHFEEAILLLLEQAERLEKTTLIGKIFKACILGKIRYVDAIILSEMVNRAYWGDLTSMFEGRELKDQEQRLFLSGLFEIDKNIDWEEVGILKVKRNDYAFALQLIAGENYGSLNGCALGILCE